MNPNSILIFDTEIANQILLKSDEQDAARDAGIQFASGWKDYSNMGVAVLCAPTLRECSIYPSELMFQKSIYFTDSNLRNAEWFFNQFDLHVSHNGDSFDAPLLSAHGVFLDPARSYDLMTEWQRETGKRVKLDDLAQANGLPGKTEDGAIAPILWQRGERERVIKYCFHDCLLTGQLFQKVIDGEPLKNPYNGQMVRLRNPSEKSSLF